MTPIGHIATVRMGVTLRGRDATRPDPNGSCRMIRISDISDDGNLLISDLFRFEPGENIRADAFLRPGDVLFPNRGIRTTAYAFDLQHTNVIVGAQFFIVRPDPTLALSAYVAWYLRGEAAAQYFQTLRKGTLVQTVQRKDVEGLTLPLPSLEKQSAIVELDRLATAEHELSIRLADRRSLQLQGLLLKSASHA